MPGTKQGLREESIADANGVKGMLPSPSFASVKEYLIAVLGVASLTIACWLLTPLTGYAAISLSL